MCSDIVHSNKRNPQQQTSLWSKWMDGGGSGVAEHNSFRTTTRLQFSTISMSITHIHKWFCLKYKLKRGGLESCRWAGLKCLLPVFIHRKIKLPKTRLPQGSVNGHKLEISLCGSLSPQRLRAQWQVEIQNKTANWISHHYKPTQNAHSVHRASWTMKTISFYAWRRIKGSTTWAYCGHGGTVVRLFLRSLSVQEELWVMFKYVTTCWNTAVII